jgi:hypothetical protein
MSKFGIVLLLLLLVTAGLALAPRQPAEQLRQRSSGVDANERLTAVTGLLLYVLVGAIAVTILLIKPLLSAHYLVGLLLIPPVALKLGTTGYRFARYYAQNPEYVLAGPPPIVLRLLIAPALVVSTLAVFITGLELWIFGLRFGSPWVSLHTLSAVFFMLTLGAHLLGHLRRSGEATLEEIAIRPSRTAFTRRSLLVATLLLGAILASASLLYSSPFPTSAVGG